MRRLPVKNTVEDAVRPKAEPPSCSVAPGSTRVVLLSIDPWTDDLDASPHFRPFNYSARKIQAALLSMDGVTPNDVTVIDSFSRDLDALWPQIEAADPNVLALSTYVWSFPTFCELARKFKSEKPDAIVVMGGPCARVDMFELEPFAPFSNYVDAIVVGEGEIAIQEIVSAVPRHRESFRAITGLALHTDDGWMKTDERPVVPLDYMPSPFQQDLVDCGRIGPVGSLATLETFRGCPLSCKFCQWGVYSSKDRVFSADYLVRELDAIERSGATGILMVDAALNLNMQAFRHLVSAEAETGVMRRLPHFHAEIYPSAMKPEHLAFLDRIEAESVGIGLQTLEMEALKAMDRHLKLARFKQSVVDIAKVTQSPHIDLILGLPGDSPDSFRRTLEQVRRMPAKIKIYPCLVLPDALLSRADPELEIRFDPYTLEMTSCRGWTSDDLRTVAAELDAIVANGEGLTGDGSGSWTIFDSTQRRPPSRASA